MSDLLFNIEPVLSPRLKWMAKHGIITVYRAGTLNGVPTAEWDASDGAIHATGNTEIEACEELGRKLGINHWTLE